MEHFSHTTEENESVAEPDKNVISPKKNTARLVAAAVCLAVSAFSLAMGIISGGGGYEIGIFFASLFMIPVFVCGTKYFVYRYCFKHGSEPPELIVPLYAVGLELAAVPMFYFGLYTLFPLLLLPLLPIMGIVLGIAGICNRKKIGNVGLTLSIIAVALPVLVTATFIILLSARVIVIRWM